MKCCVVVTDGTVAFVAVVDLVVNVDNRFAILERLYFLIFLLKSFSYTKRDA